ncbi:MAG: coenzyme F420-0:L-glutamate ligase [Candidatus Hodarchaeaceae archaeon]|nr:coenzyme F420-0:L-glutamate ligase [Candidatus Hodarchaeaceae archaeon]
MRILGLSLPLVKPGDDLPAMILDAAQQVGGLRDGDVVVVSSKVVATAQGRVMELAKVRPSARAKKIAAKSGQALEFVELVLREAGQILGVSKGVILTVKNGIVCANAGVDASNAPPGHVVLMPAKPDRAAEKLRLALASKANAMIGVIISDSSVKPLRLGTVGQAIGVAGMEPVIDCRGQPDLYGKPLRITFRAIADQLATAAQVVMGEGNERMPVVVVRDVKAELVEKPKLLPKISPKRCIYFSGLRFK